MNASVRAPLALSFLERYSSLVIDVVSSIVLARLLSPHDVGVFTVALAFSNLAAMLRNFGVATYLIQEKELTEARLATALGMVMVTATAMGLLLVVAAPFVAEFYHQPGLRNVLWVLAANFLFVPFNSVVIALLRREINYKSACQMSLAGSLSQAVIGISLAWMGWGYMGMAWGAVANGIGTTLAAMAVFPVGYNLRVSFAEWRHLLHFGIYASSTQVMTEIGNRAPDLIIGHVIGLPAVGLLSRANGLVTMAQQSILMPVLTVALSSFAATNRNGVALKQSYLLGLSLLSAVALPAFIFMATMAEPIILVLFGHQWAEAVPLARWTCAAGAVMSLGSLHMAVFQATGAVHLQLRAQTVVTVVGVVAVLVASRYGIEAVAATGAGIACLSLLVSQAFIRHLIGVGYGEIVQAVSKSVVIASAGLSPLALLWLLPASLPTVVTLIICCATFGALWMALVFIIGHPLGLELRNILGQLRATAPRIVGRLARRP